MYLHTIYKIKSLKPRVFIDTISYILYMYIYNVNSHSMLHELDSHK